MDLLIFASSIRLLHFLGYNFNLVLKFNNNNFFIIAQHLIFIDVFVHLMFIDQQIILYFSIKSVIVTYLNIPFEFALG